MLSMFKGVTPYLTPKPKTLVPRPDNVVFRMHYRLTFAILLVCCILVSSYQYIDSKGSAIQCLIEKNSPAPQNVVNRFCWIQSTFTLPEYFEGEKGTDFIHFGVGETKQTKKKQSYPIHSFSSKFDLSTFDCSVGSDVIQGLAAGSLHEESEKTYHAYYQWVPLMLAFQAIFFYAPHWIWKQLEGGRMKHIIYGLNVEILSDDEREEKIDKLAEYMRTRIKHAPDHQMWAFKFFMCECLNFINVMAQIFITDAFLGGEFTTYGMEVLRFASMEPEDRVDPMSKVFPKMTKCTFYKYGGSGTLQLIDALCVLGMNILNEKIYIFLWFWFIILAVITGVNLVVRIVQLSCPSVRNRFVKLESRGHLDRKVRRAAIEAVVNRLSYADWLILYYLAQSMDKTNFGELLSKLDDDLPQYSSDEENMRDDGTMRSTAKFLRDSLPMSIRKNISS